MKHFWLNQKVDHGSYKDEIGKTYHYRGNVPGYRQLEQGDKFVYYQPGEFVIFGSGKIGEIEVKNPDKGVRTEYFASIEEYTEFDPPIQVREIKEDISFLREREGLLGVPQSGIRQISEVDFNNITSEKSEVLNNQ